MFSAFFGNYLLNQKIVTRKQLKQALSHLDRTRLKLGTLAINAGYMSVPEVEEVHTMQLTTDAMFGDLAIEEGYLTEAQLDELLESQKPYHLLLAQSLVDLDVLTMKEFNQLLQDYKEKHKMTDETIQQMDACDAEALVEQIIDLKDDENADFYKAYLSMFIKCQIRFVSSHVKFEPAVRIRKRSYEHLIRQAIHTDTTYFTALAGREKDLTAFAGLYANEKFKVFGDYPIDAIGEYMNQSNGLFVVNQSNEGHKIRMDLHTHIDAPTLKPYRPLYDIPIKCSSGNIHLLMGLL